MQQVSDGTYTAQNLAEYSFMVNGGSSIAPINTDIVVDVPDDLVAQVEATPGRDPRRHVHDPDQRGSARRLDRRHPAVAVDDRPPLIEVVSITKRFGALVANDDISLSVHAGEVHALIGENGAGKSTLTRILYGLSQPDAGEVRVDGRAVRFGSPKDAMRAGVGMVTQEFSLVGPMTVTENVMLTHVGYGPVDRRASRAAVVGAAERLGVHVDPDAVVESLSVGERQRVEIVKALSHDCRVLILDEPTAVLVPQDVQRLFASIRSLTAAGIGGAVHLAQAARGDGDRRPGHRDPARSPRDHPAGAPASIPTAIAALMMGAGADDHRGGGGHRGRRPAPSTRRGEHTEPATPDGAAGAVDPRAQPRTGEGARLLDDVGIDVAAGEIVGVAGVSGNGQTELVDVLCATRSPDERDDRDRRPRRDGRSMRSGASAPGSDGSPRTAAAAWCPACRWSRTSCSRISSGSRAGGSPAGARSATARVG